MCRGRWERGLLGGWERVGPALASNDAQAPRAFVCRWVGWTDRLHSSRLIPAPSPTPLHPARSPAVSPAPHTPSTQLGSVPPRGDPWTQGWSPEHSLTPAWGPTPQLRAHSQLSTRRLLWKLPASPAGRDPVHALPSVHTSPGSFPIGFT